MSFTDFLPLYLSTSLSHITRVLEVGRVHGLFVSPRGSQSSNDLRLWTDDAVLISMPLEAITKSKRV